MTDFGTPVDASKPEDRLSCAKGHSPVQVGEWIRCARCHAVLGKAPKDPKHPGRSLPAGGWFGSADHLALDSRWPW